jgi:hypothetical protein
MMVDTERLQALVDQWRAQARTARLSGDVHLALASEIQANDIEAALWKAQIKGVFPTTIIAVLSLVFWVVCTIKLYQGMEFSVWWYAGVTFWAGMEFEWVSQAYVLPHVCRFLRKRSVIINDRAVLADPFVTREAILTLVGVKEGEVLIYQRGPNQDRVSLKSGEALRTWDGMRIEVRGR